MPVPDFLFKNQNAGINASAAQASLALVLVDQHGHDITEKSELENGTNSQRKAVGDASKTLQEDLKKKHLIFKKHDEDT